MGQYAIILNGGKMNNYHTKCKRINARMESGAGTLLTANGYCVSEYASRSLAGEIELKDSGSQPRASRRYGCENPVPVWSGGIDNHSRG